MGSVQKRKAIEGGRVDQVFPPGQVWPPKYPQKLRVKKKKSDKNNRSHFMIPFLSSKCELIYSDRKQTRGCLSRAGVRLEGGMAGAWGNFGADQCLDYDDSFRSVYMGQNL